MKLLLLVIASIFSGHTLTQTSSNYRKCLRWLVRYEWMEDPKVKELTVKETKVLFKKRLARMQQYYKVSDATGICDQETLEFMSSPRCGNTDATASGIRSAQSSSTHSRNKRWAAIKGVPLWTSSEWGFNFPLTIGFKSYSNKMTHADQDAALLYCATRWAEVSGISFQIVFGQATANIFISFLDSIPNDEGDFGILALAESPTPFRSPPESLIQFDSREPWVAKWTPRHNSKTISFQAVLCHEIGHSLALDHTSDSTAVMFAELVNQTNQVMLGADDIEGIQALYGRPNGQVVVNAAPAPMPLPVTTTQPTQITQPLTKPITTVRPKGGKDSGGGCTSIINKKRRRECFDKIKSKRGNGNRFSPRGRSLPPRNRSPRRRGRFRNGRNRRVG